MGVPFSTLTSNPIEPSQHVEPGTIGSKIGELGILAHHPFDIDREMAKQGSGGEIFGNVAGVVLTAAGRMVLGAATEAVRRSNCRPVPEPRSSKKLTSGVLCGADGPIKQVSTMHGFRERVRTIAFAVRLIGVWERLAGFWFAAGVSIGVAVSFAAGAGHEALRI